MAGKGKSWIKLYRSLDDSEVLDDAELLRLWIVLLIRANWKKKKLNVGITLQPGQLVVSLSRLAERFKCNKTTIKRRLKRLQVAQQIVSETQRGCTVVTICNWQTYQGDDEQACNADATPTQLSRNSDATLTQPEEEGKKERRKEDTSGSRRIFVPPSAEEADQYAESIGYALDGEKFVASYEAKGWVVGKAKMKDWRAAVRNWKANGWGKREGTGCRALTPAELAAWTPHG